MRLHNKQPYSHLPTRQSGADLSLSPCLSHRRTFDMTEPVVEDTPSELTKVVRQSEGEGRENTRGGGGAERGKD